MTITVVFDPPLLADSPAVFNSKAFTLVGDLNTFSSQANSTQTAINTSESNAATSATNASTSATNAATSATNAATSETNAATSATNAANSYDAFDDRFLGAKASDPTLDNDGNALLVGALYWSTTSTEMRAWSGSAWVTTSVANALSRGGDIATGPIVVPSGAAGAQAIGADEAHTRTDEVVLNGGFSVAQEALGSRTDDTYGHDGWIVLTQTGAITPSTLTDVEDGTPYMARLTQSQAAAQRMGYLQVIEGQRCRHLRGQQVTFRFGRMRLSASANVRIAVLEWTGTEDSVTSDVVADWTSASYTSGGFFNGTTLAVAGGSVIALSANTLTTPAGLTVTLGSTFNNLMVFAWVEAAAAQNVTLDLGKAQLDIGAAARPFRHYHPHRVLMDCSRYLVPLENKRPAGQAFSASAVTSISVYTPVPMRATPSISSAAHSFTGDTGGAISGFTVSATNVNGNVVRLDASGGSLLVAGNVTMMVPAAGTFLKSQL